MKIANRDSKCEFEVDENTSLDTIRSNCPGFFRTPHGQRETYAIYRGFLIVRNTVKFGRVIERRTIVYLYDTETHDTFCVSAGVDLNDVAHAHTLIDRILTTKAYAYDILR